jgi:transposase
MPTRKYIVQLSGEERTQLETIRQTHAPNTQSAKRANVLLLCEDWHRLSTREIAYRAGVSHGTVERLRKRYAEAGLGAALSNKPRAGAPPKLDGKQVAFVVALACSATPKGQERWTMQMLADKLVELGIVETPVSHDTVRRVLKKTTSSLG